MHKSEIQKLVDNKASNDLTWNVRRSEWESLCEKVAIERDALRADNERIANVSAKFEEMFKASKEESARTTSEVCYYCTVSLYQDYLIDVSCPVLRKRTRS